MALVPIFTIVVALVSTTPFFGEVMAKIKLFLHMNLLPDIADTITNVYMRQFAHNARSLTAAGVAGVFVVAVWMMLIMDRSLNVIWCVRRSRPIWKSVLGYVAVMVIGPILIVVSVAVTTYIMSLSAEVAAPSALRVLLLRAVPVAMSALAFFLVYRIIPHRHVPWRHAALGGGRPRPRCASGRRSP